jgi:hypothetical protein
MTGKTGLRSAAAQVVVDTGNSGRREMPDADLLGTRPLSVMSVDVRE